MEQVMKEIVVNVEDRPGTLLSIADALGSSGVNIEGFSATSCGDEGVLHFVCDDPTKARQALEKAGFAVSDEREVTVVAITKDRPGMLATLLRPIAEQGLNLGPVYCLTGNRIALGSPDLGRVRDVLSSAKPEGARI